MKESKASPVRLISLPYLTWSVDVFCMEVHAVEPRHNEVPRMTNDVLYPSNNKMDEKEPRYNETSF